MLYNEAGSNTLLWSRVDLGHKMPSVCLLWCDYGTVVFRWLNRRTRWIHPKIPARKSQGHKKSETRGIDPRKNDRSFYEWPNSIPFPFLIIFSPHALATKPVFFPWHFFWSFPGLLQTSIDKGIAFSLPFLCLLHQAAAKTDSLSLNLKLSFFFNWVIPARSGWVPSPEWLAFTHQLVHPVSSESWCVTGRQTANIQGLLHQTATSSAKDALSLSLSTLVELGHTPKVYVAGLRSRCSFFLHPDKNSLLSILSKKSTETCLKLDNVKGSFYCWQISSTILRGTWNECTSGTPIGKHRWSHSCHK